MSERKSPEAFLSRWSRRKLEAAQAQADAPGTPAIQPPAPRTPAVPPSDAPAPAAAPAQTESLPPVEALTFDSDFQIFMKPGVDPDVRRAALRKLLHDPRFNVMDGLDVYIDDYTKPSPLEESVVRKLAHARYLFSPPATRVNADGIVEDVPEPAPSADAAPANGPAIAAVADTALPAADPLTDPMERAPSGAPKPNS
jgi:hypothetical protein